MKLSTRPADNAPMIHWAQWYASMGWSVMPLHEPIFDDTGKVCGCTCEEWKRANRDPEYVCKTPGKHPIHSAWEGKATTDLDQIRRWWRRWPTANIGLAVGKSGLLTLDLDAYKDAYDGGDLLTRADENTITQLSGGGGSHLLYAMPEGKAWGNHRGELPAGIDVRGHGGMQVLAPSLHPSGRRYAWELDYGPDEISALPVPDHLAKILDESQQKKAAAVTFSEVTTEKPDLAQWKLTDSLIGKLHQTGTPGGRSERDMGVICRLIENGLTADDVRSVFQHYPIGTAGKYAERGDDYLALTYAKSLAKVEAKRAKKQAASAGDEPATGNEDEESKQSILLKRLAGLGKSYRLNVLEDTIEVDGERLDEILLSQINLALVNRNTSRTDIADGINVLAGRNRYHPVRDYLNSLQWDGRPHVKRMMNHLTSDGRVITYESGNTEPLHHLLIYRWLLGCVARALDSESPNTFRHQNPMLTLIGNQGIGKSTWVRWLASGVGPDFHREGALNPHSTDDVRGMCVKWIWEVSELGGSMRRADRDSLKAFITTMEFTYRRPYARFLITKPVLASLVGTLNDKTFLDDPTGSRRFLPVTLTAIDHSYSTSVDVNQMWAELVHRYRAGDSPQLSQMERAALSELHEEHTVENPLETYINLYFDVDPDNDQMRTHTATIIDRLRAFEVSLPNELRVAGRAIGEVLTSMGLDGPKTMKIDGVNGKGWAGIRPNNRQPRP